VSDTGPSIFRYRSPDDEPAADTSHRKVLDAVGGNKRVLELGSAIGDTTRRLSKRGCTVVAIERDPEGVVETTRWAERVLAADLDQEDFILDLAEERFDVIVAADVLEHLREPARVLRSLRGFLAPGGFVVASIPNVAHGAVRLALLEGHFDIPIWACWTEHTCGSSLMRASRSSSRTRGSE